MITETQIERICDAIESETGFDENLPEDGELHVDKLLPYICVYRYNEEPDPYFTRLVKTQGSYLIIKDTFSPTDLLKNISQAIVKKLNAFLIIELWPERKNHDAEFTILAPKNRAPATVKALERGLNELRLIYPKVTVKTTTSIRRHPEHLAPLLNIATSKDIGSLVLGLGIPTLYERPEEEEIYSLFFRKFFRKFSEILKRTVFEFIRVQTANPFNDYLMLGKTKIDQSTLEIDEVLADISQQMDFLLRITPVNSATAYNTFQDSHYAKTPAFTYRLIALDPELTKRKLYDLAIDKVQDPTLAYILRDKRLEIEKQLLMLEERGTPNFKYTGESLYGIVETETLDAAQTILENFPVQEHRKDIEYLDATGFAHFAQQELDFYQKKFPKLELKLEIRPDIAGIMVSGTKLLISDKLHMDGERTDALIQHEIGTHILTYCNGRLQPLKQMYAGFAGYDKLQEGLAVLAEYLVGGLTRNRLRLLAGRVIAVHAMIKGEKFPAVFHQLKAVYNFPDKTAYYITMRVFRGGGLTKDGVYLSGFLKLLAYLENGGELDLLFSGKFNHNHIPLIRELTLRGVLHKPMLPNYLNRPDVKERLKTLRAGIQITELLNSNLKP